MRSKLALFLIYLLVLPPPIWGQSSTASDWTSKPQLLFELLMNDDLSSTDVLTDISSYDNPFRSSCLANVPSGTVFEGGAGAWLDPTSIFSDICNATCEASDGCSPTQLDSAAFGTTAFTCYFFHYPEDDTGGDTAQRIMGTNVHVNVFGGWMLFRDITTDKYIFRTQVNNDTPVDVSSTTTSSLNNPYLVMIRRVTSTDIQEIGINGTWEASASRTGTDDITGTSTHNFTFGTVSGTSGAGGNWDFAGCWNAPLADTTLRKILVCGSSGFDCTCQDGNPGLYYSRPRHSSEGGLISGAMDDCNAANISQVGNTTTTTSTPLTTSTSTSTTTTTTTSTSVTTTTSTTNTSSTTSTSTSIITTTSTSTTTTSSTSTSTIPPTFVVCADGCEACNSAVLGCCSQVCGMDGLCKISSGHAPGHPPNCHQYNDPCTRTCQCCDSMICENERCREPAATATTTTSTSSSTTTSTSSTTTTSTSSTSTSSTTSSTTTTSTSSTTSTTEVGATTTTSTTLATTTTTTLATTTTTTTITTTSTSSTTSTSTTTSSTTSTVPAPDWSDETAIVLYLRDEEVSPSTTDLTDSSPATNNLSSGMCSTATADGVHFWDGATSLNNDGVGSDTCEFGCNAGDGCTDSNFRFTSGDFTCGFMGRPSSTASGDHALILGTSVGLSPGGWQIYKDLITGKWAFYIADGSDGVSVLSTTNATNDVTAMVTVRYDASTDTMFIRDNGVQEDSATQQSPSAFGTDVHLMGSAGLADPAFTGSLDHIWCANRAFNNLSMCRVEVCGLKGELCTCNGTAYVTRPKPITSGGPINCTLPSCNTASPTYLN